MKTMRAFFAISLPPKVQTQLASVLTQLKQSLNHHSIRWTAIENIHVTLQFIPNLKLTHLHELVQLVQTELKDTPRFSLDFNKIELFPSINHPRIISFNVGPNAQLTMLSSKISKPIALLGYPLETRPFRGHITLGRIRGPGPDKNEVNELKIASLPPALIDHVVLLESRPNSESSNYFLQAKFKLM